MKISPQYADKLSGWAEEYYNPDLPYHNWGHAEEVMSESLGLLNTNGRWTRHINRPLLQIAAAWHDAGHDHDERHAFESAEHYSAYLMRQRLKGELPGRQMIDMEASILGTRLSVPRQTMGAIALHYGDVSNMSYPFKDFLDHASLLWSEYGKPDWVEWRNDASVVIGVTALEAYKELPLIGINGDDYAGSILRNLDLLISTERPI